ncbi:hypothetical protein KKB17_01885 [bacterium]|nr:hypothetical protein [Candidatus Atribacteria bacterium]MBU4314719.1 hypothetical protein [Actinomycetota bacterium]MBU4562141.1 hypothetical protein [bacterium]
MDKELKKFIEEGVTRYKETSRLMVLFGKTIEGELQGILSTRKEWGTFKPDTIKKKVISTKYWHEYPLLNAKIFGKIGQKQCTICIAINWFWSDTDYPHYEIRLEKGADEELLNKFMEYSENGVFEVRENSIILCPNPEDFNLHRDFNKLIDEFIKII